jgi:hypothetical protein
MSVNTFLKQMISGEFILAAQLNSLTENVLSLVFRVITDLGPQIDCPLSEEELPSARAIYRDLLTILGFDAASHAPVTRSLRELAFVSAMEEPPESPPPGNRDEVDDAILLIFTERQFASLRDFSQLTSMARTSVHRGLTASLGFTPRHLR